MTRNERALWHGESVAQEVDRMLLEGYFIVDEDDAIITLRKDDGDAADVYQITGMNLAPLMDALCSD